MQATFYLLFLLALLGNALHFALTYKPWTNGRVQNRYTATPRPTRIWLTINYAPSQTAIPVRVITTDRKALINDIEIITDRRILAESWDGYSYGEILGSLTPEQIDDIKELRTFLI